MAQQRAFPRFLDEWREVDGDSFTPLDYLTHPDAISWIISAQWLFVPDLAEYRGGVFHIQQPRGLTQDEKATLDDWFSHLYGDVPSVERISNQLTLWDQFGNADMDVHGDDFDQLAQSIGEAWDGVLRARYPNRRFIVEVTDEENGSYGPKVTFFSDP